VLPPWAVSQPGLDAVDGGLDAVEGFEHLCLLLLQVQELVGLGGELIGVSLVVLGEDGKLVGVFLVVLGEDGKLVGVVLDLSVVGRGFHRQGLMLETTRPTLRQ
jgi:hypothetical protein